MTSDRRIASVRSNPASKRAELRVRHLCRKHHSPYCRFSMKYNTGTAIREIRVDAISPAISDTASP